MKSILNSKFTVQFVELIIVCCIFITKYENIAQSQVSTALQSTAVNFINGFLGVSVAMIAVQMMLCLMGLPLVKELMPYQMLLQIIGLFCYGCYILMKMNYVTISYIWGVFCLLPFLIDVVSVIAKRVENRKYSHLKSI